MRPLSFKREPVPTVVTITTPSPCNSSEVCDEDSKSRLLAFRPHLLRQYAHTGIRAQEEICLVQFAESAECAEEYLVLLDGLAEAREKGWPIGRTQPVSPGANHRSDQG